MRVAIVGGVTRTGQEVLDDDDREIWTLNAIRPAWLPNARISRHFNLHRYEHLVRDWKDGLERELKWAKRNPKVPFYVIGDWPSIPKPLQFPLNELRAFARGGGYHAGSFDMMVAFAMLLKAKDIALHGINLNMESGEPLSGRACLEYWCGMAEGRGIKVHAASDCDLFAQYHIVKSHTIYGYDDVRLVEHRT